MPLTIAIFGDSYVEHLRRYCENDLRVPGKTYWFGKGGMTANFKKKNGEKDVVAEDLYQRMLELRPDVAFINVSGNDITTATTPKQIYDRVVKIVSGLQEVGTRHIFIAEIMTRGDFSKSPDPGLDKTTFDKKREKINSRLAKTYKDHLIRFSDMRYPRDYHTDLVHLMTESSTTNNTGMRKYESHIRRLLCSLRS